MLFGSADMRFTLRQIEVFLAVARSQSVSRAAESLAMSQSAVSGALGDLEHQFDVLLFERNGKRLALSELGRALRAQAEALAEQARELEAKLQSRSALGLLRVGATLSIGNYLCVPLMARFMREHPGASVTLHVANTAEISRQVQNFEIDIGLVEGELSEPNLEVTRWRQDELAVFCAPSHPFAQKPALGDDELRQAAWIVREHGSGTRQAFEHAMHGLLVELHVLLELQHTEAIISAVKAGLGVGCVSRIALEEGFAHGSLVRCSVPGRDFKRHFYFVLHKQKYRSQAVEAFLELCRGEADQRLPAQ
jgi:DNA-binding transcriptional LysR family regulator